MKKVLIVILIVLPFLGFMSCTSLEVKDPSERAALRTRDTSCPIDSVFTATSLRATFNIVDRIKPKALLTDFREAQAVSQETKALARVKDSYNKVRQEHSEEYSPGLTIYMALMLLALVVIVLVKTARALFKNT